MPDNIQKQKTPPIRSTGLVRRGRGPVMTYQIAMAIGFDEGERHAKKNGRKVWTVEDFDVATRKTDSLLECDPQKYEQGKAPNEKADASRL